MRTHRVESSVLALVAHDTPSSTLEVTFRNGRIYEYYGVPRAIFEELLAAGSIGKYFNEEIKPRYPSARVRRRGGQEQRGVSTR